MVTLGWKASAEQFPPAELLELAVAAETAGVDSIVVSDHFHPWRDTDGHAPFSFAWLAAAGQRTKRARLAMSVVSPGWRYHPAIVAQAVGTLALLTPGRVATYLDLRFDHLVFHLPAEEQKRSIDLVGKEILPRLRRKTS